MKIIRWLLEAIQSPGLSIYQSLALLIIFSSPTPEIASELTEKNQKLIEAVMFLKTNNLIYYSPSGYKINQNGLNKLKYDGYVDESGRLTQKGKTLLNHNY